VLIPQPADNRLSALPHVMPGSKRQLPAGNSVLLIHHYIAAFGELHSQGQSPEGAWELRVLCNIKGNLTMQPFGKAYAAARYSSLLSILIKRFYVSAE
jgi:hypothetical protein